jgi:hypothetical protein
MTNAEKIALLQDIVDGEIINPATRKEVGEWAISLLKSYFSYNLTNGDVLLDLLKGKEDCIYPVGTNEMDIRIDCEWWNSPYQKGGKE